MVYSCHCILLGFFSCFYYLWSVIFKGLSCLSLFFYYFLIFCSTTQVMVFKFYFWLRRSVQQTIQLLFLLFLVFFSVSPSIPQPSGIVINWQLWDPTSILSLSQLGPNLLASFLAWSLSGRTHEPADFLVQRDVTFWIFRKAFHTT